MNRTLFVSNIKSNWGIFAFVAGMLLIYFSTSVAMYDPSSVEKMESMFNLLPKGMLKAFGFDNLGRTMTGYLAHYLYGFIIIVFPIIYIVIVSHRLVAKHVDSGSMAYLLTTPNTRVRIAVTQGVYLLVSLLVLLAFDVGILLLLSQSAFPGLLDIGKFLVLNLATYLVLSVVCGIGFFFSCLFNDTKNAIAFGGGIPIAFVVIKMVSEFSADLEWMRFFTLFTVLDIDRILESPSYAVTICLVLAGVVLALFIAAVRVFDRKNLAI